MARKQFHLVKRWDKLTMYDSGAGRAIPEVWNSSSPPAVQ
jgi:hypothetical protein